MIWPRAGVRPSIRARVEGRATEQWKGVIEHDRRRFAEDRLGLDDKVFSQSTPDAVQLERGHRRIVHQSVKPSADVLPQLRLLGRRALQDAHHVVAVAIRRKRVAVAVADPPDGADRGAYQNGKVHRRANNPRRTRGTRFEQRPALRVDAHVLGQLITFLERTMRQLLHRRNAGGACNLIAALFAG